MCICMCFLYIYIYIIYFLYIYILHFIYIYIYMFVYIYIYMYSGAKKYLVSHQLCKFSHLKRWERPVIFIIGIPQLWETKYNKKSRKSHCRIFKEFICKLWWKISIWSITKFHLNTLLYTLCWQWQRSNVFCKSSQGFHTLLLVFWPIPPCRSPLEQWCFGTFNSLQRFSMGLRSGDWLGHSRTLKCFLRSHSFVARAVCLGSLSCWKTQPRFIFNALADGRRFSLNLTIHGSIHSFLYTDQSSWSLCRKTAPKHDVSTPMRHSRYGVL